MINKPDTYTQNIYGRFAWFYNFWVSRFGLGPKSRLRQEAVAALKLKPGGHVLDLCCGTGLNFPLIQTFIGNNGSITGVDLTNGMLEQAKKLIHNHRWANVELVCCDLAGFVPQKMYDAAVCTAAFAMVANSEAVIQTLLLSLKPGGRLVILDAKLTPKILLKPLNGLYLFMGRSAGYRPGWKYTANLVKTHALTLSYHERMAGWRYLAVLQNGTNASE